MREFSRAQRIAASIKRELAPLLQARVRDAGLGLVTVTAVEVSADYHWASVYVTVLGSGSGSDWDAVAKRLADWTGELRHELAQALALRSMPRLRFIHDESIARAARIGALLNATREHASEPDLGLGKDA